VDGLEVVSYVTQIARPRSHLLSADRLSGELIPRSTKDDSFGGTRGDANENLLHARGANLRRCALCWVGVAGQSPLAAADDPDLDEILGQTDRSESDAPDLDEILGQIGLSQSEADLIHADYVQRLEAVAAAINNCREFLSQHGDDPEVRAILRRTREGPNEILFTDPTTIGDLAEAVGGDISLSQQDLEICLRSRDDGLGDLDEQQAASFGRIAATLDRCLQTLDQVGPDPAGVEVLQRASRLPADPTYTSGRTLERLEQAVGDLALTRRDLETCTDAFHQSVLLEQSPLVGDNPPPCTTGETPCPTGPPGSGEAAAHPAKTASCRLAGTAKPFA
jgi:hypothetical protein